MQRIRATTATTATTTMTTMTPRGGRVRVHLPESLSSEKAERNGVNADTLLATALFDRPPRVGPHVLEADPAPEPSVAQEPPVKSSMTDHSDNCAAIAMPRSKRG